MKLILVLIGAAFGITHGSAQHIFITGGPGSYAAHCQTPVGYQSQVVYQTPVVYQPPVVYAPAYCAPAPNVIYFGGPCSYYQNYGYSSGYYSRSPVIYFGRGQSCLQGYRFRHCR